VKVEIDLSSKRINFSDEDIDLALRMGKLDDTSQVSRPLGRMSRSLYAAPSLAAHCSGTQKPTDLQQQKFVLLDSLTPAHLLRLNHEKTGKTLTINCTGAIRVNNMGMLIKFAAAGAGIALIPDALAQPYVQRGQLSHVVKAWHAEPIEMHLVYRSRTLLPQRLQLFMAHMQAHILKLGLSR
jgi:DNA-binding transcriptional LysR family regulator